MRKLYKFSFDGLFLGGQIMVIETTQEEATRIAKAEVGKNGFNPESVKHTQTIRFSKPNTDSDTVVHFDNGDY